MTEETKQSLQLCLELLRTTCISNGVSIAVDKETGALNFFDTNTYLREKRFDGIRVEIQNLVE